MEIRGNHISGHRGYSLRSTDSQDNEVLYNIFNIETADVGLGQLFPASAAPGNQFRAACAVVPVYETGVPCF